MRYAAVALIIGVFLLAGSTTQSFANPALANCRVCGDKVAKEAATCPHCGAPKPWDDSVPQTTWYPNGQKESEGHYKNGKQEGLWTYWRENGQKSREYHFKDGKPEGIQTEWHENGQKLGEGNFKNGKLDGLRTWWDENGQKASEAHYKNGKELSRKRFR